MLSKLADIVALLAFINRENVPPEWISDIEDEIKTTISLAFAWYGK